MKRLLYIPLLLALLTGCAREAAVVTVPPETTMALVETTPPATTIPETTVPTVPETTAPPADEEFVRILDYIPSASQALPYATAGNFTGQVIYDFQDAYLRYGTVKKLMLVSEDLAQLGLYLKIWDGFRPVSAQWRLWEAVPNPTYVANPNVGFSSHSRGNTVDLTLVDENGQELEMPTGFDDFTHKADRNYADCTETARNNAMILESIMEKHGFSGYAGEWWHYSDTVSYPVEEQFCPQ